MAAHGKSTALPALLLVVAILAGTCASSTHALVVENLLNSTISVSVNNQPGVTIQPGASVTIPNTTGLLPGPLTSLVVMTEDGTFSMATSVLTDLLPIVTMALMTVDVGGATTCVVNSVPGITSTIDIVGLLGLVTQLTTCLGQVAT